MVSSREESTDGHLLYDLLSAQGPCSVSAWGMLMWYREYGLLFSDPSLHQGQGDRALLSTDLPPWRRAGFSPFAHLIPISSERNEGNFPKGLLAFTVKFKLPIQLIRTHPSSAEVISFLLHKVGVRLRTLSWALTGM